MTLPGETSLQVKKANRQVSDALQESSPVLQPETPQTSDVTDRSRSLPDHREAKSTNYPMQCGGEAQPATE